MSFANEYMSHPYGQTLWRDDAFERSSPHMSPAIGNPYICGPSVVVEALETHMCAIQPDFRAPADTEAAAYPLVDHGPLQSLLHAFYAKATVPDANGSDQARLIVELMRSYVQETPTSECLALAPTSELTGDTEGSSAKPVETTQYPLATSCSSPYRHAQVRHSPAVDVPPAIDQDDDFDEGLRCRWDGCTKRLRSTALADIRAHIRDAHFGNCAKKAWRDAGDGFVRCRWEHCRQHEPVKKAYLDKHIGRIHLRQTLYKCTLGCKKKYTREDAMKRHARKCRGG